MSRKKFFFLLLFLIFFISKPGKLFAADCGLAKIEPGAGDQNWNVTYCVTAPTETEVSSVTTVTATCRSAPGAFAANCSCHPADWYTNPVTALGANLACQGTPAASTSENVTVTDTVTDSNGQYLTCFTLTSLDRNMGVIDVQFKNSSGNEICPTQSTNVTPGNYGGLLEYFQNTIATRTGLIPTYTPNQLNPVYCSDVSGKQGIDTALGCISFDAASGGFVSDLIALLIGLGGGLTLLLILYGIFIITTSAGIPEKLNTGKDIITSAVAGLLFIILSIFLTNLIGIRILAIPGLQ